MLSQQQTSPFVSLESFIGQLLYAHESSKLGGSPWRLIQGGIRGLGGLFCLIDCNSGGEELEVLADAEGLVGFCFMLDV